MTRTILIFTFALLLFMPSAYADNETVQIKVNGMVCDFCARALEKVFGREEAVEHITVSLTDKLITVQMKEGKTLPDDALKNLINDAGYDVREITRTDGESVHD